MVAMSHLEKSEVNNFDSHTKAVAALFVQYSPEIAFGKITHSPRAIVASLLGSDFFLTLLGFFDKKFRIYS